MGPPGHASSRSSVQLAYWGGSIPLAWRVWEQNQALPARRSWGEIDRVLDQVARLLPPGWEVVVVADRAYDLPAFVDQVAARGWQWEQSQVQGLGHHQRLLLAMAWATLVTLCLSVPHPKDRLATLAARPVSHHPPCPREPLPLALHGPLPDIDAPNWLRLQAGRFLLRTVRP